MSRAVLAPVEPGQDRDEPDGVDVPDARRGEVADPRRVAGQGQDVADAQGMGAEQLRLERHEVPVAGREVDEALEVEVVLDAERDGDAAHPDPGHGRVADIEEVDAGLASSRAASIVRSMRIERGGSISTETTNGRRRGRRPSASATWDKVKDAVMDAWHRVTGQQDLDVEKMSESSEKVRTSRNA